MNMSKNVKSSDVAKRAWNVLRLALLWARKGGIFRRRLLTDLRLFPNKLVKTLGHVITSEDYGVVDGALRHRYGEHQMSFDDSPVAVKFNGSSSSMRFLNIPCLIKPPVVDFDYEFDLDDDENDIVYECPRKSDECDDRCPEENNIDSRAEEFIAKFYEQIKMQRQISYLQYN